MQYIEHLRKFQSVREFSIVYMNISFLAIARDLFGDESTKWYG